MQTKTRSRGSLRLTRRGRLVLLTAGVLVTAAVVAVFALLPEERERPTRLTVVEGWRAGQVYAAVDKALGEESGTTKKAARTARLRLPSEAEGNPEGYLFPATYPLDKDTTPASLLSYMVNTAEERLGGDQLTAGAERNAVNLYQTVTIASMVQAEAAGAADMGKVARVIYNRLDHGLPLQMDSTLNYALGRSVLDTTHRDTRIKSRYNTYARMGLPPTPIGNPGSQAMAAALNPPSGDWLYFVTVKDGDTRFTADYREQRRNVAEFNRNRKAARERGSEAEG
ncbi:aminodeoxychorismate lyase [Streptomyces albus]|uniref:Endolytic murein transglycosylase n=1 Tax=Streptomyces albus (strain ATCC 21838 / DSM 41398 / FERM P-419 / JCM 4703 / NBRC 107858) TaxID=1081613 RepID=A0A0B5EW43_STRA4|nr:aminodeoxychorismate lyase [Streptomyces albus]AOU81347.1 aminodeoxychorismate lyase [Streptomyces albus]AYN37041.1 aminodeoxychorismate lyase [Streptomyces albus]